MDWLESCSDLLTWTRETVFRGNAGCCSGRHVRDLCLPEYQATNIAELEQQRQLLGLALVGQVVVIGLRVVTGHVGGGAIGLVLFVWGNRARCSLNSTTISGFVMAGSMATALDTFSLFQNIVMDWGFSLIALPFELHLGHNLTVISALLAPASEILGVQSALASMITPDMLFQRCRQEEAHVYPTVSTMATQALHTPLSSLIAPSAPPSSPPRSIAGNYAVGASLGLPEVTEQVCCSACGTTMSRGEGWNGTGEYTKCVYCHRCWVSWRTPNRIG